MNGNNLNLWKVKTNLESIIKSRDITLLTKVHLVKAMVFPVIMYECELDYKESWMLKNWCFWTVVLEKTLESALDCKEVKPVNHKGNQSWTFIGKTCWNWNSNTLATWCEELTRWKRPWYWGRLKAGGEGDNRGWDGWIASLTWWTWVWVSTRSWWWTGDGMLQSMGSQKSWTWLSDWTELKQKKALSLRLSTNGLAFPE